MRKRHYTPHRRISRLNHNRRKTHKIQKGGEIRHIIVLSDSDIKVSSMAAVFPEPAYKIHPVKIPDNPGRAAQPLFISGTIEACRNRIYSYYNDVVDEGVRPKYMLKDLPHETPVISIENGILPLDGERLTVGSLAANAASDKGLRSDDLAELMWADFCVIGVSKGREVAPSFVISPEIIGIDREDSEPFFRTQHLKAGGVDTLGKYIASRRNTPGEPPRVAHNNWMAAVAGIDRRDQIQKGLQKIKTLLAVSITATMASSTTSV